MGPHAVARHDFMKRGRWVKGGLPAFLPASLNGEATEPKSVGGQWVDIDGAAVGRREGEDVVGRVLVPFG